MTGEVERERGTPCMNRTWNIGGREGKSGAEEGGVVNGTKGGGVAC